MQQWWFCAKKSKVGLEWLIFKRLHIILADDIADFSFADEMGSLVFASGPIGAPIVDAPFVKTVALNLLGMGFFNN